jgi:hypothetical protein
VETLQAGNGDGTGDVAKPRATSALFGGGVIMQRYDPTKEDGGMSETKPAKLRIDDTKQDDELTEGPESDGKNDSKDDIQDHLAKAQEKESRAGKDSKGEDNKKDVPETNVNEKTKPDVSFQDSTRTDIYEQDKLENIFKQAREQQKGGASTTTGFSFGALFESQLDITTDAVMESSNQMTPKLTAEDRSNEAVDVDAETNKSAQLEPNKPTSEARVGLQFPQSVLDEYENLFFSLKEGPRIIADLESIRNDKEVQDQWQKEREEEVLLEVHQDKAGQLLLPSSTPTQKPKG